MKNSETLNPNVDEISQISEQTSFLENIQTSLNHRRERYFEWEYGEYQLKTLSVRESRAICNIISFKALVRIQFSLIVVEIKEQYVQLYKTKDDLRHLSFV